MDAENDLPGIVASPEQRFERTTSRDRRRTRGQFFTPRPMAEAMVWWACGRNPESFLDPACGPGIFLECLADKAAAGEQRFVAFDIDADAIDLARRRIADRGGALSGRFECRDFLTAPIDERFDAIVANPPYIRHHEAKLDDAVFAAFGDRLGVRLSRLTNVYCLFLLRIAWLLSPRGRAAVITPSEFLNADFGRVIKRALLELPSFRGLIVFDYQTNVFDGAMTTATISLFDAAVPRNDIRIVHLADLCQLSAAFALFDDDPGHRIPVRTCANSAGNGAIDEGDNGGSVALLPPESAVVPRSALDPSAKWATSSIITMRPERLAKTAAGVPLVPLSRLARCTRGIATGANAFFALTLDEAQRWGLPSEVLLPCICKAYQAPRRVFSRLDFEWQRAMGQKCFLLNVARSTESLARHYLDHGMASGVHRRYLTRHRTPWYRAEQREPADIWACVFGRGRLRFIHNQAGVRSLTPFHAIYLEPRYRRFIPMLMDYFDTPEFQAACAAEHRVYGDGLLKFEPRDVLRLPIPDLEQLDANKSV